MPRRVIVTKVGTEVSGFFSEGGHQGRPGMVGGSRSGSGRATDMSPEAVARRERYAATERARWAALNEKLKDWGYDSKRTYDAQKIKLMKSTLSEATEGKFKGHPAEFISKSWDIKGENGLESKVDAISILDTYVHVEGKIYNESGHSVGTFQRDIYNSGEVHNQYFRLDDAYEGSGFGSEFYRNAEKRLKAYGMGKITIYANINVGGYAWARMGFDFANDFTRNDMIDRFTEAWIGKHGSDPNGKFYLPVPKIEHAWDIAAAVGHPGLGLSKTIKGIDTPVHFGKYFMLDKSWNAVKYLKNDDPTWQAGEVYYNTKKKKGGKK